MRTLSRPMFRYGGPIKEGVMSGIREPKRNGGSMGNLVGSPAYPKTDGREHHFAVSGTIAGVAGLNALRLGAMRLGSRYLMPLLRKQIGTQTVQKAGPSQIIKGLRSQSSKGYPGGKITEKIIGPGTATVPTYGPTWLGSDPLVQGLGWAGKTLTSGPAKGIAGKVLQFGTAPTTLIGGLWYANGKWFNKDGSPANKKSIAKAKESTGGPPGGGDPGMQGTGEWFAAQADKEAKIAKQKEWNNRIKKYRDIMDIKGMNKEAAYKSLVDASKLIQESGDFKGDIKSGKLINQVIQAASKQFDKPAKTSDAINTLILQNELKKDLSAETDALDKAYKQSAILLNQKKLAGESLSETINASYQRTGQFPSGATLAGVARTKGIDAQVLPTKDIPKDTEALDYIVSIVTESHTNPEKSPFPPGDYVIKDRLITVDETGKVTPLI